MPSDLANYESDLNNRNSKSTRTTSMIKNHESTSSRRRLLVADTSTSSGLLNLNVYNSVVIVSIASVILVVFGLACFSISLFLYFTCGNRRRSGKKSSSSSSSAAKASGGKGGGGGGGGEKASDKIVVYDMPTEENNKLANNKQTVYSLGSSLSSSTSTSSECGEATNNISPMTTTTASLIPANSAGPLFQTHLLETTTTMSTSRPPIFSHENKSHIFDWYTQPQKYALIYYCLKISIRCFYDLN